jgi:hypothetical protein
MSTTEEMERSVHLSRVLEQVKRPNLISNYIYCDISEVSLVVALALL